MQPRRILQTAAICSALLFFITLPGVAQEQLTLEEAIRTGLENNYGIRIAENRAEIDANNLSYGIGNFLPVISATGTGQESVENSVNRYSNPNIDDQDVRGAESRSLSAEASLDWTIFDGLRMFTSYRQLGEFEELGRKEARMEVETQVAQIIVAYHNIVQQQKSLEVLRNTVEISEQRLEIAETRRDLGSGSEYDILQARSDLNADRAGVIREETTLEDMQVELNELLAREVNTGFEVSDTIELSRDLEFEELRESAIENNVDLAVARSNKNIADLEIKNIRGERLPEVEFNAGYGYNRNESDAGFASLTQSDGFNYGITARINILNGLNLNRRTANARIEQKNSRIALEQTRLRLEGGLYRQYQNYENSVELVELEEENLEYAGATLDLALERFELGTIDAIELREAQRTLMNAENRLIDAQFEAKLAETELLRLGGQLVE